MTTFNESQYATYLAANPTKYYATYSGRIINFTNFVNAYVANAVPTPPTPPFGDVTNLLYTTPVSTYIINNAVPSYPILDVMIGEVIFDIINIPTSASGMSLSAPNITDQFNPDADLGDDFIAFYAPINTTTESTIRTFLAANPNTYIVPSTEPNIPLNIGGIDNRYLDISARYQEFVVIHPNVFDASASGNPLGDLTNIQVYDVIKFHKSSPAPNDYDNAIVTIETFFYVNADVRIFVYSNIGYDILDDTGFATLLSSNPSNLYGIYNNQIYEFTNLYSNVLSLAAVPPSPPVVQDVRVRNTDADVAVAIVNRAPFVNTLVPGAETNIFDILLETFTPVSKWGVFRRQKYEPSATFSNADIRAQLSGSASLYIVRIRDTYYDISFGTVILTNVLVPQFYVGAFPLTMSVGGLGLLALSNDIVYNRSIEQDHIAYGDILGFLSQVENDLLNGELRVRKLGTDRPWIEQDFIMSLSDSYGISASLSRDGTTMAVARKAPGNPNAQITIVPYRFIGGIWQQIGAQVLTNNIILGSTAPGRKIVDLSDNGQRMIIGSIDSGTLLGIVTVYEFDGINWNIIGSPLIGSNGTNFGYTVAISGDGTHIGVVLNDTNTSTKFVNVYRFQSIVWSLITSGLSAFVPIANSIQENTYGLSIALNFDGTIIAVGDGDLGGLSNGAVRVYEKTGPTTYTQQGLPITGSIIGMKLFGLSIDINKNGDRVVIGAPDSNRIGAPPDGAVEVYTFGGINWTKTGQTIWGEDDNTLGLSVSIDSSGLTISAGSDTGDIGLITNTGYTRIYDLYLNIWEPFGQLIASDTPSSGDQTYVTEIMGSGRMVLVASPGAREVRTMILDAGPVSFDNTYEINRGFSVSGNFITDIGSNGTDNDPQSNPLSIREVEGTAFTLMPNTSEPGFTKSFTFPLLRGILYLNANGSFRYDNDGVAGSNTGFNYSIIDSFSNPSVGTSDVLFNITTIPLTVLLTPNSGTVVRNVNGVGALSTGISGNATLLGGTKPYNGFAVIGGAPIGPNSVITTALGTFSINKTTGTYTYNTTVNTVGASFNDIITVEGKDALSITDTKNYTITITVNPELILNTPTAGTIFRLVNDTSVPITTGLSGNLSVSGGTPPFEFGIGGGSSVIGPTFVTLLGVYGTLSVKRSNPSGGQYTYTPGILPNIVGLFTDTFTTVNCKDQSNDIKTVTYVVNITVDPEFKINPPLVGTIGKQINNPNFTPAQINGTFTVTSGTGPFNFTVQGGTNSLSSSVLINTYGVLTVTRLTGNYIYVPTASNVPEIIGVYSDTFTIVATDSQNRVATDTLLINIGVAEGIMLISGDSGTVTKSVNGTNITLTDTSGTLNVVGPVVLPVTYGIVGETSGPGINEVMVETTTGVVPFGTQNRLVLNTITGVYTYTPGDLIDDKVDIYIDRFTFTVIDSVSATITTTTPYSITINITPQLLIDRLNPSAGSITRNISSTGFSAEGLSGFISPVGGLFPYEYGIFGVIPVPSSPTVSQTTLNGTLTVNRFTGTYNYVPITLPSIVGITTDSRIITVTDKNGITQQLNYDITFSVIDISISLLPIFTDVETRSNITYWDTIIHDITTSGVTMTTISFENTEILVIGNTESASSDPQRKTDDILRTLLTRAIETTYIGSGGDDVLFRIKTNTQDVLASGNRSGAQNYSFSFMIGSSSSNVRRVTELADILSSRHLNFLLDRYRANIADASIVFYFEGATNTELDSIAQQVVTLNMIGVGNIILTMVGLTDNPNTAGSGYSLSLQDLENRLVDKIVVATNPTILNKIIKSSVRYGLDTSYSPPIMAYLNVFTLDYVINSDTIPLFRAISLAPPNLSDADRDLRIIITNKVLSSSNTAIGEITYDKLTTAPLVYTSSRILNPSSTAFPQSNRTLGTPIPLVSATLISAPTNSGLKDTISFVGTDVVKLRTGDVLYPFSYTFQQPQRADILLSVVSGVIITPVINQSLIMQIGDGFRFPNNSVFATTITTMLKRYNSNTLEELSTNDTIEYGYDYIIRVNLPTNTTDEDTFRAAGLEQYVNFPRLGVVTLYFGRQDGNGKPEIGIGPFGRGAVVNIDRS